MGNIKNLNDVYAILKSNSADVGTFGDFQKFFEAPGTQGYQNRKRVHGDLVKKGLYKGNYESFAKDVGLAVRNQRTTSNNNSANNKTGINNDLPNWGGDWKPGQGALAPKKTTKARIQSIFGNNPLKHSTITDRQTKSLTQQLQQASPQQQGKQKRLIETVMPDTLSKKQRVQRTADNINRIYDTLGSYGAEMGTRDSFNKFMYGSYTNRKQVYDDLVKVGEFSGSYDDFMVALGMESAPNNNAEQWKREQFQNAFGYDPRNTHGDNGNGEIVKQWQDVDRQRNAEGEKSIEAFVGGRFDEASAHALNTSAVKGYEEGKSYKDAQASRAQKEYEIYAGQIGNKAGLNKAVQEAWSDAWRTYVDGKPQGPIYSVGWGMNMSMQDLVNNNKAFDLSNMASSVFAKMGNNVVNVLMSQNPGMSKEEALSQAEGIVNQYVYNYAVQHEAPKSSIGFFGRKIVDGNTAVSIIKGLARSQSGSVGTTQAAQDAVQRYGDKHQTVNFIGDVAAFGLDLLTNYPASEVGGLTASLAAKAGARGLVKKGVEKSIAKRIFMSTPMGRFSTRIAGGAGNMFAFEGFKGASQQFESGEYDAKELGLHMLKGAGMGAITGVAGHLIGNAGDKAVKLVDNGYGKAAIKFGTYNVSKVTEGTIFAAPDVIANVFSDDPNKPKNSKIILDSVAMMYGLGATHGIKDAAGVIASAFKYRHPRNAYERKQNMMSVSDRIANYYKNHGNTGLSQDELNELNKYGYGDLATLFSKRTTSNKSKSDNKHAEERKKWVDEQLRAQDGKIKGQKKVSRIGKFGGFREETINVDQYGNEVVKKSRKELEEEFDKENPSSPSKGATREVRNFDDRMVGYDKFTQMYHDMRVSQATREKMMFMLTGHMSAPKTIVAYRENVNDNGTYTIETLSQDGDVVTSKTFGGIEDASKHIDDVNRQIELNIVEVGEQNQIRRYIIAQNTYFSEAIKKLYGGRAFEEVVKQYNNVIKGIDKSKDGKALVKNIKNYVNEKSKDLTTDSIRASIKSKIGVDVYDALKKKESDRTDKDNEALAEYYKSLYEDVLHDPNDPLYDYISKATGDFGYTADVERSQSVELNDFQRRTIFFKNRVARKAIERELGDIDIDNQSKDTLFNLAAEYEKEGRTDIAKQLRDFATSRDEIEGLETYVEQLRNRIPTQVNNFCHSIKNTESGKIVRVGVIVDGKKTEGYLISGNISFDEKGFADKGKSSGMIVVKVLVENENGSKSYVAKTFDPADVEGRYSENEFSSIADELTKRELERFDEKYNGYAKEQLPLGKGGVYNFKIANGGIVEFTVVDFDNKSVTVKEKGKNQTTKLPISVFENGVNRAAEELGTGILSSGDYKSKYGNDTPMGTNIPEEHHYGENTRLDINGNEYTIDKVDNENVSLIGEDGRVYVWRRENLDKALENRNARIVKDQEQTQNSQTENAEQQGKQDVGSEAQPEQTEQKAPVEAIKVGEVVTDAEGNVYTVKDVSDKVVVVTKADGSEDAYDRGWFDELLQSGDFSRFNENEPQSQHSTEQSPAANDNGYKVGDKFVTSDNEEVTYKETLNDGRIVLTDEQGNEFFQTQEEFNENIKNGYLKPAVEPTQQATEQTQQEQIPQSEGTEQVAQQGAISNEANKPVDSEQTAEQQGGQVQHTTEAQTGVATQGNASDAMPTIEVTNGKKKTTTINWTATTPERGHKYVYEEMQLPEDYANQFVDGNLEEAQKRVDKLQKNKPKISLDPDEFKKNVQEYQAQLAEAQKLLDYWNAVKAEHERVKAEETKTESEQPKAEENKSEEVEQPKTEETKEEQQTEEPKEEEQVPTEEAKTEEQVPAEETPKQTEQGESSEQQGTPVGESNQGSEQGEVRYEQAENGKTKKYVKSAPNTDNDKNQTPTPPPTPEVQNHDWSQYKEGDIFDNDGYKYRFEYVSRDENGNVDGVVVREIKEDGSLGVNEKLFPLMFMNGFKKVSDQGKADSGRTESGRVDESSDNTKHSLFGNNRINESGEVEPLSDGQVSAITEVSDYLGQNLRVVDSAKDKQGRRNNGLYDPNTGTMYLARDGQQPMGFVFGHEATHAVKELSDGAYNDLHSAVRDLMGDEKWNAEVAYKKQLYKDNGIELTDDGAAEEVVADYIGSVLNQGENLKKLAYRLKHPVLSKIRESLTKLLDFFRGKKMTAEEKQVQGMLDTITEAMKKAVKDDIEKNFEGVTMKTEDGTEVNVKNSIRSMVVGSGLVPIKDDGRGNFVIRGKDGTIFTRKNPVTANYLKAQRDTPLAYLVEDSMHFGIKSPRDIDTFYQKYADMLNAFIEKGTARNGGFDALDATWQYVGETVYKVVAKNSDKQYSYSLDITRVCKKNEAVLDGISEMQKRVGYGITPGQIMEIYLETDKNGYQVPCPVCYVFSRYIRNGQYATIMINGQRKYGKYLVDPKTLSEAEKKEHIKFWVNELKKAEKENESNKATINSAKKVITECLDEIDQLSWKITKGKNLSEEERNSLIKQVEALDARYRAALNVVSQASLDSWIKNFAIKNVGKKDAPKWVLIDDTYQGFNEADALDFKQTAKVMREAPAVQRYRKSRGASAGKEITFAADNAVGDVPMALGQPKATDNLARPREMSDEEWNELQKKEDGEKLGGEENFYVKAANAATQEERDYYRNEARKSFGKAYTYIQQQNLRGGQRQWSWSDNVERLAPDVSFNLMQVSMLDGAIQTYSKQLEGVEMVASMDGFVNGSLMGKGNGVREVSPKEIEVVNGVPYVKSETTYVTLKDGTKAELRAIAYKNRADGKYYTLVFDNKVGIEPFSHVGEDGKQKLGLFDLNAQYDRAGNILVGMNDIHVRAALSDPRIMFVIPWHSSGANNHILTQMYAVLKVPYDRGESQDYTSVQEEKKMTAKNENKQYIIDFWEDHYQNKHMYGNVYVAGNEFPCGIKGGVISGDSRLGISKSQAHYRALRNAILVGIRKKVGVDNKGKNKYQVFDVKEAKPSWYEEIMADEFLSQVYREIHSKVNTGFMTSQDKGFIYPYEYWDKFSTIENADINTARYLEYCRRLGYKPKFAGMMDGRAPEKDFGNFMDDAGAWKLLIDRRMYDLNGKYQDNTPIRIDGFHTDLVDPSKTSQRFDVTRVADLEATKGIVDNVLKLEDSRVGGRLQVDYNTNLNDAIEVYNKTQEEVKATSSKEIKHSIFDPRFEKGGKDELSSEERLGAEVMYDTLKKAIGDDSVLIDGEVGQRVLDDANKRGLDIREHKVFHGSAADFDHFDHSHMGEGEGAQVYGWGTYVTDVEGIGRTYAVNNTRKHFGSGTRSVIYTGNVDNIEKRDLIDIIDMAFDSMPSNNESLREALIDYMDFISKRKDEYSQHLYEVCKRLDVGKFEIKEENPIRHLYTIEIPEDTGENYIDWDEPLTDNQIEKIRQYLTNNYRKNKVENFDASIAETKNASNADEVISRIRSGKNVYKTLKKLLGSDKNASIALSEMGFTGIKYPADYMRGGRSDGAKNYVIFNENDAKITDHVRFFRTKDGVAYGFTIGGKVYIDPRVANSETPIHEYSHLWATAMQQGNPKEWKNIVKLMKGTSVWDEVKKTYPELENDSDIADEVLAHYSGRRGAERLREQMRAIADGKGSPLDKADAMNALHKVKAALNKFWKGVADFLGIHFTTAEEVADRVMKDLLDGVDPREHLTKEDIETDSALRFHKEKDEDTLKKLNSEPTIKVYRAMQVIDGKLYPPMAAKVGKGLVEPNELGVWIRADENPDLTKPKIDKTTGETKWYFDLQKGSKDPNGNPLRPTKGVAYNPYWHTSLSPLNDQFATAWIRPNLVVVECEIPASELTSGYKAEKAHDSVGETPWKSGKVSTEVRKQTGRERKVILSRWCKPVRILSDAEVAQKSKEFIGDADVEIPENVLTPRQKVEFEKVGLKVGAPESKYKKTEQIEEAIKKGLIVDNSLKSDSDGGLLFRDEETNNRVVNPTEMSEAEKAERGEKLLNAPAIEVSSNQIVKSPIMSARKASENWWRENIGEPLLFPTEVGTVEIDSKSIGDSLAHGYNQSKLDAVTSLKDGFKNAVYLGSLSDFTRTRDNVQNHYFAYPIIYDGKRNYVFCRAMQDNNKNRLYVHEVFLADNLQKEGNTLQTAAFKPHGGIALYKAILTNVLSNAKVENNSDISQQSSGENLFRLKNGTFIKSGSYFSGGGLLEEGLKRYLDPSVAVEFNEKISGVYADNFGNHIVTADVRDVDPRELAKHVDGEVQYFHASPVCKNYSRAKRDGGEVELDKETAQSTADFISAKRPKVVTIENVKGYKNSEALKIITDELTRQGYDWDMDVYNAADYGGYTKRERLIIRAVRDGKLPEKPQPLPESERKHGWMEAVEDLIDDLPEKEGGVKPWMDERLKGEGIDYRKIDKPLYVFGQGNNAKSVPHAFADELIPTLRTHGGDVIIMPDGRVLQVTPRVLARLTGLGDDYVMPKTDKLAHTIIGNGIPTQLSENVIGPLLDHAFNDGERASSESMITDKRNAEKRDATTQLTSALHLDGEVEILDTNEGLEGKEKHAKGWYDPNTGKITVVLGNHESVADVQKTIFHEAVAHKGLRAMVGEEKFGTFIDNIYKNADKEIQSRIDELAEKKYKGNKRVATEEYMASLAEDMNFEKPENKGLLAKVKKLIVNLLKEAGIDLGFKLTDKDLRYMLWRSYKNLQENGGKRNIFDIAEDARMRERLEQTQGAEERAAKAETRQKMFRDGNDTLRGVVDGMRDIAQKMVSDKKEDKQKTIDALTSSLREINKAMSAQRAYDLSTVKSVTGLVKAMLDSKLIQGVTDYEQRRMLSVIENVHGKGDTRRYVTKLMDIAVGNMERNASSGLMQLLHMRGQKVDQRGVVVQKGLDPDGQKLAGFLKSHMGSDAEAITNRMIEVQNRMSSNNEAIAESAAIEYQALQLADYYRQYIKDSKENDKQLRQELADTKENWDAGELQMTKADFAQYQDEINFALLQNKIGRTQALHDLISNIGGQYKDSAERAKAWQEQEKKRVGDIYHNANSDLEGVPCRDNPQENMWTRFTNGDNAFGIAPFLFEPQITFANMLEFLGNKNSTGKGYLYNRYMHQAGEATNNEIIGYRGAIEELDNKAKEMFGKDFTKLMRQANGEKPATLYWMENGENMSHQITVGNMLYIYMVNKMADGRMKLRKMGISDENVNAIVDKLNEMNPSYVQFADWMQNEFLPSRRNKYNEVHKRMFGTSMPEVEDYFPLKILKNAIKQDHSVDATQPVDKPSTTTGAIKKRTRNSLPLDLLNADAFEVLLGNVKEMEHWAAFAEFNRDINTLLNYKKFRNKLQNMNSLRFGSGKNLLENFTDACKIATGTFGKSGDQITNSEKIAVNATKLVTAAKIAFRINTALKQLLSFPAYFSDANPLHIGQSLLRPDKAWKFAMTLPQFRERFKGRMAGDPMLAATEADWKAWRSRFVELAAKYGMSPNAFVDAVTVSIGAHAMYKTRYQKLLKQGYEPKTADAKAREFATEMYNKSQQSSVSMYMSPLQSGISWYSRLFTLFRNASMSYSRQTFAALQRLGQKAFGGNENYQTQINFMTKQFERDGIDHEQAVKNAKSEFWGSIGNDAVRVAVFNSLLAGLWNLGSSQIYQLFGSNDEDKKKLIEDSFIQSLWGGIEGLTGGDIWSNIAMAGYKYANGEADDLGNADKNIPMVSDMLNTYKYIGHDNMMALQSCADLIGQSVTGVAPTTVVNVLGSIWKLCSGDADYAVETTMLYCKILNAPKSNMDKIYLDEIGTTLKEGKNMSVEEIAKRYAEYKRKNKAPLVDWAYSDEDKEKANTKYAKEATDKAREIINGEFSTDDYKRLVDESKQTGEKLKKINELEFADRDEYNRQHSALVKTPEYRRHMVVEKQKNLINKAIQKYLREPDPNKRAELMKYIDERRDFMVNQSKVVTDMEIPNE